MQQLSPPVPMEVLLDLCSWDRNTRRSRHLIDCLAAKSDERWEIGINDARWSRTKKGDYVSIEVDKPAQRRDADTEPTKWFKLDPEGLRLLMLHAVAGARVEVIASRGSDVFHYLGIKFSGTPAIDFQRLVVNAPHNQLALMGADDHRDLRRRSLGFTRHQLEHQRIFGRGKVLLKPYRGRAEITRRALKSYRMTAWSYLFDKERYLDEMHDAYGQLDSLPLGPPTTA